MNLGTGAVLSGELVVAGGLAPEGETAKVESYDPVTDRWSRRAPLPQARSELAAAVLGDHKPRRGLNDAANACLDLVRRYRDNWERPLRYSRAGRELVKLGFRDDLREAARMDAYAVLPHFHERRVTLATVPV